VETLDLQLVELDEEFLNKLVEYVVALSHQFRGLLFGHQAGLVDLGGLKVGEKQNEHLLTAAGDLNKVDIASTFIVLDLVEVPIEHLSQLGNAQLVIAHIHRRRSFGCY
jgi:hypothetical protein